MSIPQWQARKGRIAEQFYEQLKRKGELKTYTRDELRIVLNEYKQEKKLKKYSLRDLIYYLELRPALIRCNGQLVHFKGGEGFPESKPPNNGGREEKTNKSEKTPKQKMDSNSDKKDKPQSRKVLIRQLRNENKRAKYMTNDLGITIDCLQKEFLTDELGFYECSFKDSQSAKMTMQIQNETNYDVIMTRVYLLRDICNIEFSDSLNAFQNQIRLPAGCSYNIDTNCSMDEFGSKACDVIFEFSILAEDKVNVTMARLLSYHKINNLIDSLKPTAKYVKEKINPDQLGFKYGNRDKCTDRPICSENKLETEVNIDQYKITREVRSFVENVTRNEDHTGPIRTLLESELTEENYTEKFSHLIWIEEIQLFKEVNKYGKQNKMLEKSGKQYKLELKDLAERRPSVLRGDQIFVISGKEDKVKKEFQGFVFEVKLDHIVIGFSRNFAEFFNKEMRFAIRFGMSRFPFRGKQRSIGPFLTNQHRHLLFPEPDDIPCDARRKLNLYNKELAHNKEQIQAVESIVFGRSQAPYIIYGPPGTGKTSTLVEAALQVLKHRPNAHILVCAPSNNATDLIMDRMLQYDKEVNAFRVCAWSRPFLSFIARKSVDTLNANPFTSFIKKFKGRVNFNVADRDYYYPTKEELMKYNVLATTLTFAGRLASAGFPNDHFDFVFADEAANAQEPEVMTAVAGVLSSSGRLILAGDPKQLGPVITSHIALKHGLGKSYMERMMETQEIYKPVGRDNDKLLFNEKYCTKLINNYRNHEDIIKIPNEHFYDNELRACLDESLKNSMCDLEELPKQGFPIIFHSVRGKNEREENSPSYFNAFEIATVVDYVDKLLEGRGNGITPNHIGIITPYNKQVKKFRKVLSGNNKKNAGNKNGGMTEMEEAFSEISIDSSKINNHDDLKVGTVEAFQGDERRVIIISTVRSDCSNLQRDKKFNLGFLVDPKRFNVAVTRAALLLIVVGNPDVLYHNQHWRALIDFCQERGGYIGDPPEEIPGESSDSQDVKEGEILKTKHSKQ